MTCIPTVFTYTFRQWLTRHKIKSIFYYGDHRLDEPEEKKKTVYGRSADCPLIQRSWCNVRDIAESDFQQINARGFSWYDFFLPEFQKVEERNIRLQYIRSRGDTVHGDQVICNVEASELGKQLMTVIFETHDQLLDSAIRMCTLSLTSDHLHSNLRDHAEWLKTVPDRAFQQECVHDVDTYGLAWGPV
jgi:hypothetical protein